MSWFGEDNGFRCSLESKEDGEEVRRHDLDCDAVHRDVMSGGPCDLERSRSGLLDVFPQVEGTVREDYIGKLVVHQDTMVRYCLVGRKIPSWHTELADRDAICNPHAEAEERNESAEEGGVHRIRHRNQNRVARKMGVLLLELLEVARDVELEIRFDPEMDVMASR
jgi:hypothetical protein